MDIAVKETVEYQWGGQNARGSIGYRISFFRMAFFLIAQKPLSGWGEDGSWKQLMNHPDISFADQGTKDMALHAGFHNEITGNAHFFGESEKETLQQIRELLSFLPSSWDKPLPETKPHPPKSKKDIEEST